MKDLSNLSKLCTPARLYFASAILASVFILFKGLPPAVVIVKLFFAGIWAYVLNWLCSKGYKTVSWALVILPYLGMFITVLGLLRITNDPTGFIKMFKLKNLLE